MATYLRQNPHELPRYEAYGILCNLRNTTEILQTVEQGSQTYAGLSKQITEMKEAFKGNGLQFYSSLSESDLDNSDKVRKASTKALFQNLPDMLKVIKFDETNEWMKETFQIYNIGSQISHSQMESLKIDSMGKPEHVIYSKLAVDRYLMCFLINCFEILQILGFMKNVHNEALLAHIELSAESLKQLVVAAEEEMIDSRPKNQ